MGAVKAPTIRRSIHANDYDNGFDIAKSVFQVHGVDAAGQVVIRRQLKRRYVLAFFQKLPPVPTSPTAEFFLYAGATNLN